MFGRGGSRRRRTATALAAAGVTLLAACGSGKYTYVSNTADQTFMRVPKAWKVFEVPGSDKATATPSPWQRVFDGSTTPKLENAELDVPTEPIGRLSVYYVNASTADTMSPEDLRAAVSPLQADPLTLGEEGATATGQVVAFDIEGRKGGLKGSHVVYEIEGTSSSKVTFDQTTLLDPKQYMNPATGAAMFKVYVLSIHCSSECYEKNKTKIADVVNSWTVNR